ncbi:MAG: threonine--tRNA ligase [Myxococcales bacterium]|nr:threonine--tRNA ligase [Myxococcales bacterium]
MISVRLPDGSERSLDDGSSAFDLAQSIADGLARRAIAAKVNGRVVDLSRSLAEHDEVQILTENDEEALEVLRHSTAHILASAVKRLWKDAKISIGPVVNDGVNGFYYDFEVEEPFTPDDLEAIEKEMQRVIGEKSPFLREVVSREEAHYRFAEQGEPYKLELLDAAEGEISIYHHGEFDDLCRGPHLPHTGFVKSFKLLSHAGAYWRGDSNNQMLQRIYGIAFFNKKQLRAHLNRLEEAKKRDHRKLGRELGLFTVSERGDVHREDDGSILHEEIGQGLVLWLPRGGCVREVIESFWRKAHRRGGYDIVYSPHVAKSDLWRISGHLDFYSESMYSPIGVDEEQYLLKPMNCPFHVMMYKHRQWSYRELPLRLAELGTVYRYELAGALHGLMRVRGFTQDDAHLICTRETLGKELIGVLDFVLAILKAFGFEDFEINLSTRPDEKYVGDVELWDEAEELLREAIATQGLDYVLDAGGGAFYGPKIDVKIKDALNRTWQCSTVQLDFNLPERFGMSYIDAEGGKSAPILIHRALLGSLERFFGILIEHYAGDFPPWLAPEQARILTISERAEDFAREVDAAFRNADLRVSMDLRNESLGRKIRDARLLRIPYLLVIGDQEVESRSLAVRSRQGEQFGVQTLEQAVAWLETKTAAPHLDL